MHDVFAPTKIDLALDGGPVGREEGGTTAVAEVDEALRASFAPEGSLETSLEVVQNPSNQPRMRTSIVCCMTRRVEQALPRTIEFAAARLTWGERMRTTTPPHG